MSAPSHLRRSLEAGVPILAAALLLAVLLPSPGGAEPPVAPSGEVPKLDAPIPSRLEIRVNIPAYRLDAIVDGEVVARFPVTVGAPHEPTPDGRYVIDRVAWNPWWHPPAHRRPKDRVTSPGPRNPMGRVKLHFAADLYYVHGTALTGELGRPVSRGCIRLRNEDAIALAALVHEHAGPALPDRELQRLVGNAKATRHLVLDRPVSLRIVYELLEIGQGELELHEDIYRRLPS